MARAAKILAAAMAALLLLAVGLALAATRTDIGRERVRRMAVGLLAKHVHGQVHLGRLSGNLLEGATLSDLIITDSAGSPFVSVPRASLRWQLGPLLHRRIVLSPLTVERPVVVLDRPPGGAWNFDRIFPPSGSQNASRGFGSWITLDDVTLHDGRILVRMSWAPADTLQPVQRDSVIAAAFGPESRDRIERVGGGFQQVMDFRDITGRLPHIRLADPDTVPRLIQVATLRMTAEPYRPPAAEVRDVRGTFLQTSDSVWWRDARVALPATHAQMTGAYRIASGDIALAMQVDTMTLGDVRFLYPRLPAEGGGTLSLTMATQKGGVNEYRVKHLHTSLGAATVSGDIGLAMSARETRFHDTDLRFTSVDTRLLEQLVPNLHAPMRGTLDGRAHLDGTSASMRLDADVAFAAARGGTSRVIAVGEAGTAHGVVHVTQLALRLAPLQLSLARLKRPSLPVGGVIEGNVTVNGSTANQMAATADLEHRDRGARSHLVGSGSATLSDQRSVHVQMRVLPLALATVGRFVPAAGLQGSAEGTISASGPMRDIVLAATFHLPDGGSLGVRGRLDAESAEPGYDVAAGLDVFNLRSVTTHGPVTSLTATLSARGRGVKPATMHADLAADAQRSEVDSVSIDSLHVRVRVADGLAAVDSTSFRTPWGELHLDGTLGLAAGRDGTFAYAARVDSLSALRRWLPATDTGVVPPNAALAARVARRAHADSLRQAEANLVAQEASGAPPKPIRVDTLPTLRRDSLAGTLYAAGVAKGNITRLSTRGRAGVEKLVASGNLIRRGRAEYTVEELLTPTPAGAVEISLDSAQAVGFDFDSATVRATYRKPDGHVELAIYQDTGLDYRAQADLALLLDRSQLRLRQLAIRFDTSVWKSTGPSVIDWGPGGVEVKQVELRDGVDGRIFVNGTLPSQGPMDLVAEVHGLQLANIVQLLQRDVSGTGVLMMAARLTGTQAQPVLHAAAGLANPSYHGTPLPDVRATALYEQEKLVARAELTRAHEHPVAVADASVPINLSLSGYSGPRLLEAPLVANVRADSLQLETLAPFIDAVSDMHGRVIGALAARGTPAHPTLAGAMALDQGSLHLVALGITLDALNAAMRIRADSVLLDSLVGRSANGPFRVAGALGIANPSEPSFDLKATATDAQVINNETGQLRANANLAIKGAFSDVAVTGRARITSGVINIPAAETRRLINISDPSIYQVLDTSLAQYRDLLPGQNQLMENLRVDVSLGVERNTWARSHEANVEFYTAGPLAVHMDRGRGALALDGTVNSDRGEYNYLGHRFVIQSGSATFLRGDTTLNPLVQANANYTVQLAGQQPLEITINIAGTAQQPTIALQSNAQPPLSQSDLLSYLAFGSSSASLLQQGGSGIGGGSGLAGQVAASATRQLAAVALGVLADQAQAQVGRSLGTDVFTIRPADIPTEASLNGVAGVLEGTEIEAGKYFSQNTFAAVQVRPAGAVPGFRLNHRARKGFRVDATFESRYLLQAPSLATTQQSFSTSVFGLFLGREWRF